MWVTRTSRGFTDDVIKELSESSNVLSELKIEKDKFCGDREASFEIFPNSDSNVGCLILCFKVGKTNNLHCLASSRLNYLAGMCHRGGQR